MTAFAITAIPQPTRRPLRARASTALGAVLFVAALVAALVMLLPTVLGYQRYVLVSGSMTGTYDRGSVVYAKPVPVGDLQVGDVITYAPPAGMAPYDLVTHRVAAIDRAQDGRPTYRTKGDANPAADPWQFTLDQPQQARVQFGIPYVGYAFSALGDRQVRMGVLGVPAILIALLSVGRFVRDTRREAGERRAAVAA